METIARNKATVVQIRQLGNAPVNPLAGKAWPQGREELLRIRRELPVYECFEDILDAYHENQVFVLCGETGSGKSTQVAHLLVYDEYASGLRIVCTQPRRVATTQLAKRVAKEMGVVLGEEVGYHIARDTLLDEGKKKTRLVYMTEGSLLNKMTSDPRLSEYACVIIDEAHERTVEGDLLMAMLKRLVHRRDDLKVIIMSATLDAKFFQNYFDDCPLVHITGRNFKVDIRYTAPDQAISNFKISSAMLAVDIHKKKGPGNILIFVPGKGEIIQVCDLIRKRAQDLDVRPLHAEQAAGEQKEALESCGKKRKCIVATNVAETSLTIDGVVYVVDCGLQRQSVYNPRLDMHMIQLSPISKASAQQRAGRNGRTQNGVCYRLYSKKTFDNLANSTEPAIRQRPFHAVVLRLLALGWKKRLANFDWLDPPHPESVARAVQDMIDWEYLKDGALTLSGRLASRCPLDPIWYRAIEIGAKLGCSMDLVNIAVVCSTQHPIFRRPAHYDEASDVFREAFTAYPSDHMALVNAFYTYMKVYQEHEAEENPEYSLRTWCESHFLSFEALEEARQKRLELYPFLISLAKLTPTLASVSDETKIRKALAIGFCTQTAIRHGDVDEYRTVHENVAARLSVRSSLVDGNFEWVVYNCLKMVGGHVYLETATVIDPEWLLARLALLPAKPIPLKGNGLLRQDMVKQSLDAANTRKAVLDIDQYANSTVSQPDLKTP